MIPASQLQALRQAAENRPGAAHAGTHLDEIARVLSEELPQVERSLLEASRGPEPLESGSQHLLLAGGKRVRPVASLLVGKLCDADMGKLVPLAAAIELVHSATLLHDDVLDEGETRRGRQTARVLWGNLVSVLSGDLLLTSALQLVQQSNAPGAMEDALATMQALIAGEVAQLKARGKGDLGLEGYFEIVRGKTASLFANACRNGARCGAVGDPTIEAAGRFGERVGIAFQIIDDVLDIEGVPHEVGKQLGHDLAEGKTTLPLALALQEDGEELHSTLIHARAGDTLAAAKVVRAPQVQRACAQARAIAERETEAALGELALLPERRERELLQELVLHLIERRA